MVLAIQPSRAQAVVRHEPLGGKPGSTAVYRIVPASDARRLHIDDRIAASVDSDVTPATLSDLHILPAAAAKSAQSALRVTRILREGEPLPSTPFVDENGKPFTFASLRGRDVVIAFIYTRCRDAKFCPLISAKFAQLQETLAPRGSGAPALVEVTLDPDYDTPPVLRRYAKLFGARWTMVTGDPDAVLGFDAQFGIQPFADPAFGLIHNERTVIADRNGTIRYLIDDPAWEPAGIVAQLDAVDGRPGNWLAQVDLALSRAAVAVCGNGVSGFSGLLDLAVFLAIAGAFGWLFYRIARAVAAAKP